jgi:tetratricopeptide (TPR) repeat protein
MVSRNLALLFAAVAALATGQPANPSPAKSPLVADTRTETGTRPAAESKPVLSLESRGDIYMARKMYREAIEVYRKAPQDSAVIWNKIGIAYHQMQELNTAKKHYERAIKMNPKYSEAINNLGTVYYAQKNYRHATSEYRKALKIAPNSASIHSNLGTAHFARKKYKEAFEEYQLALNIDPEVFEHRSTHGVLLQERTVAERAKFHFYLSKTYAKAGQNERALQYMRMALEEGFREREKFREDPEFQALKDLPEYQLLLELEPRVL